MQTAFAVNDNVPPLLSPNTSRVLATVTGTSGEDGLGEDPTEIVIEPAAPPVIVPWALRWAPPDTSIVLPACRSSGAPPLVEIFTVPPPTASGAVPGATFRAG